ncbi:MAG: DUF4271 domain-containing protein [Bacteroidota bacterium]
MKKILFIIFLWLRICSVVFGQIDTIIVHDYTQAMVTIGKEGSTRPVISLAKLNSAGFFLSRPSEGNIRVCNENPFTIWVNGRLFKKIDHRCQLYNINDFFQNQISDTLFISIYSTENFKNFSFEKVVMQDFVVINNNPKLLRLARNVFREFTTTAILIIVFLAGFISTKYPGKLIHFIRGVFNIKQNSIEYLGIQLFSELGVSMLLLLSLIFAFLGIYVGLRANLNFFIISPSYSGFFLLWLKGSFFVCFFILLKWVLIFLISTLFGFRKISSYQLFDFISFGFVFSGLMSGFALMDFLFGSDNVWFLIDFHTVFIVVTGIFISWITLRFVNHSSNTKFLIISYLCATEIIPAMLLIGWFFK